MLPMFSFSKESSSGNAGRLDLCGLLLTAISSYTGELFERIAVGLEFKCSLSTQFFTFSRKLQWPRSTMRLLYEFRKLVYLWILRWVGELSESLMLSFATRHDSSLLLCESLQSASHSLFRSHFYFGSNRLSTFATLRNDEPSDSHWSTDISLSVFCGNLAKES